jgi:hypothetical protein
MLQPDGRAAKARIGVLVPHMELVAESEFAAMAPAGVSIHAARVPLGPFGPHRETRPTDIREMVSAFTKPPDVDRAAAMLAAAPLNVIVFAFTSSSYLLGADADASLKTRLEENTGGIPVVIQCAAAVAALRAVVPKGQHSSIRPGGRTSSTNGVWHISGTRALTWPGTERQSVPAIKVRSMPSNSPTGSQSMCRPKPTRCSWVAAGCARSAPFRNLRLNYAAPSSLPIRLHFGTPLAWPALPSHRKPTGSCSTWTFPRALTRFRAHRSHDRA